MSVQNLKTELSKLDKKQLIGLFSEIYQKNKDAREYLDHFLTPDEGKLLEKYKKQVLEGFFPKRGGIFKLSIGRKAVSEFKKYEPTAEHLADLMLYYVECGVDLTEEFGDIDEPFYNSISGMLQNALELMQKNILLEKFKGRVKIIAKKSEDIGWGFGDDVGDLYSEYFEKNERFKKS